MRSLPQLRPERRVSADGPPCLVELAESRHQGLRHEPAPETAFTAPSTACIRLQQAGMGHFRPGRKGRQVESGSVGALDEESDEEGVFGRTARLSVAPIGARPAAARLHAARHVDAERWDLAQGLGDVGRGQAAGQDHRQPACHARGDARGRAPACAAGRSSVRRVEQEAGQVRSPLELARLLQHGLTGRCQVVVASYALGRQMQGLAHRQGDRVERLGQLVAVELHLIEAEPRGDGLDLTGIAVGEDAYQAGTGTTLCRTAHLGDKRCRLCLAQGAPCARHEVEADGIRTSGKRRAQTSHLCDAADLDRGLTRSS